MKIVVVAIGTAGDVFPFIGLGRAFVRRGHTVRLLSLHHYQSFAEAAGLQFEAIPGVNGATGHADFYHPTRSMQLIARQALLPSIRPVYERVTALAQSEWRVIADQVSYGARLASEKLGFRLVTGIVSPFMLRSTERMPVTPGLSVPSWAPSFVKQGFFRFVSQLWDRELAPEINRFRESVGLARVRDILYNWSLSPDRVVGLFPEWFAARASDWPEQLIHGDFTGTDLKSDAEPCDGLSDVREPMVIFCAGSAGTAADRFFQKAIQGSAGRHWTAVLLAPHFRPTETLPANVVRCGYVPLNRLLPRAAAIVHHGGLGTISCALSAGVPQIVMPFGHDQFDNACRVERLGVGQKLTGRAQNHLAGCIESVLQNEPLAARCRQIAAIASRDSALTHLCETLESEWRTDPNEQLAPRQPQVDEFLPNPLAISGSLQPAP